MVKDLLLLRKNISKITIKDQRKNILDSTFITVFLRT